MTEMTSETGLDRECRPGPSRDWRWHILCVAIVVAVSTLLFLKHLYTPGTLIHVDMTFPLTIGRNFDLYSNTWWQYGSVQNIWNVQRVFWAYPLLAFARLARLSQSQYIYLLFWGTFCLAGISMYAFFFHVTKSLHLKLTNRYAVFAGAVVAALFYMYNPWSLSHLWPYFGYPAYAVLPLVLLLLIKTVRSPRPVYIVAFAILISVASTGPICVAWFWLLILTYIAFYLLVNRASRKSLVASARVLVGTILLYCLLNANWIWPYLKSIFINKPFVPSYAPTLSQSMLDTLSASNNIANNLRLISGWGMPVNPAPRGTFMLLLSFMVPALSLCALIVLRKTVRKNRCIDYTAALFVISVLLATGTSFIIRKPYGYMTLRAPGSSFLGWMLRAPDRWLFFVPLFYGLMLGLLIAMLFGRRSQVKKGMAVLIAGMLVLSLIPLTLSYAKNVYNPTDIPKDYQKVNDYITEHGGNARVVWMPFSRDGFRYYWAPEKRIGAFNVYSSNAGLNNLQNLYAPFSLYYWLEGVLSPVPQGAVHLDSKELLLRDDIMARLLIPFSAQYLIFDTSVPGVRYRSILERDRSLLKTYETDILKVFRLLPGVQHVRAAPITLGIDSYYDELALAQHLDAATLERAAVLNKDVPLAGKYGRIDIADYSHEVNSNSGFEVWDPDGLPAGWSASGRDFAVQPSSDVPQGSRGRSLEVINRSSRPLDDAKLVGDEVPVTGGDIYTFSSKIKYRNVTWTRVVLEGFRADTAEWVPVADCPSMRSGNWRWTDYDCSFYAPAQITRIRPVLYAGWRNRAKKGPALSFFDDVKISRVSPELYSTLAGAEAPATETTQQNPQKYTVHVTGAKKPFVLVFGEAFDPMWVARVGGREVGGVPLYSTITGFPIDRTGTFDVTIEYRAQNWFVEGLLVSLCTLALLVAFLLAVLARSVWRRRRLVEVKEKRLT
jgi:hypothetical protein